jgi:hypothetical protein
MMKATRLGRQNRRTGIHTFGNQPGGVVVERKTMDITKYLTAAQIEAFAALSKTLEELRKTKLEAIHLDLSSHKLDTALLNRVW